MNTSVVFSILCISLLLSTTGCGTQDIAPPVPVPAAPPCELDRGESTALTVNGAEGATSLEWSASSGQLTPSQGPSVTFTAPRNYSGPVVITVIARRGNAQSQGQMTCTVLAPPPTPTLEPTATLPPTPTASATPTPTPIPPIACDIRLTTRDLFPQIYEEFGVEGQFPTYGPIPGDAGSENFHCEVVSNPDTDPNSDHKPSQTVHVTYEKVADNSGWWGIATPNGYDASKHNEFCFWVYAKEPASFRVKMKDTSLKEEGYVVTIETANEWKQICTDITRFEEMGVNTQQMDNVNLGFESPWGSAEVWVTDLEFK